MNIEYQLPLLVPYSPRQHLPQTMWKCDLSNRKTCLDQETCLNQQTNLVGWPVLLPVCLTSCCCFSCSSWLLHFPGHGANAIIFVLDNTCVKFLLNVSVLCRLCSPVVCRTFQAIGAMSFIWLFLYFMTPGVNGEILLLILHFRATNVSTVKFSLFLTFWKSHRSKKETTRPTF